MIGNLIGFNHKFVPENLALGLMTLDFGQIIIASVKNRCKWTRSYAAYIKISFRFACITSITEKHYDGQR